jgi:hypothetical protein
VIRARAVPRGLFAALALALALVSCAQETGKLDASQEQRLAAEGIARRANNVVFRHTRGGGSRWDDRTASIVVTHTTILIHTNGAVEFLLNERSRRFCDVARDGNRVRISAGSGRSAESWSFAPPDDAEGWTTDIRATIRASNSVANPDRRRTGSAR